MLENEVLHIIENGSNAGRQLNDLLDGFRTGRNAAEFFPLLECENETVLEVAIWALSELDYERYCCTEIIHRLIELTNHDSPAIRFNALGAIYPGLSSGCDQTLMLLNKLKGDPNEGVRLRAEAAARRLAIALE